MTAILIKILDILLEVRYWANQNETCDIGIIIDNKLNFNSHVSAIAHKAHVRASLILRTFVCRDIDILTKAFTTYVRPILEYCTPVLSPHTACNINKIVMSTVVY